MLMLLVCAAGLIARDLPDGGPDLLPDGPDVGPLVPDAGPGPAGVPVVSPAGHAGHDPTDPVTDLSGPDPLVLRDDELAPDYVARARASLLGRGAVGALLQLDPPAMALPALSAATQQEARFLPMFTEETGDSGDVNARGAAAEVHNGGQRDNVEDAMVLLYLVATVVVGCGLFAILEDAAGAEHARWAPPAADEKRAPPPYDRRPGSGPGPAYASAALAPPFAPGFAGFAGFVPTATWPAADSAFRAPIDPPRSLSPADLYKLRAAPPVVTVQRC